MRTDHHARGFTLIELLIVITVIAILVALLLPVLVALRKKARIAATESRIQQVTLAMTHYLDRYPLLGNNAGSPDSTDFAQKPYQFLYANYRRMKEDALLELPLNQVSVGTGPYTAADVVMQGENILDCFPSGALDNVLHFKIVNKPVLGASGRNYTDTIFIRSYAGTPNDPRDDIIWCYTVSPADWKLTQSREWFELKGADRDNALSVLPPLPWP